jgi:hypothetical protein
MGSLNLEYFTVEHLINLLRGRKWIEEKVAKARGYTFEYTTTSLGYHTLCNQEIGNA